MNRPNLSHVVILSENNVIAVHGQVPWKIPEDLKRFKQITFGHPVIMGRKTFEAIGKPLPGRLNIVISKNKTLQTSRVFVASTIESAITLAQESTYDTSEICIIGGGEIFGQTISLVDRLYLTIVHESISGDIFYPDYSGFKTVLLQQDGATNGHRYTFLDLEK